MRTSERSGSATVAFGLATMVVAHTNALAARPLVTDDAGVLAPGAFEFQLYGLRQTDRGTPTTNGAHADISYGTTSSYIGPTQIGVAAERTASGGSARDGLGLGGKTVLLQGFNGVDFALAYALNWARGGAANYRHEAAELKSVASVTLEPFVVHGNAGVRYVGDERTSRFVWALAAERPHAAGQVDLGIEAFGVAGEATWVQAALRWQVLKDQLYVDASYGREVQRGKSGVFTVGLKAAF